jgi:AraC family transcriptional regulator of adaptative response/methylated-DNA-[protein]-cysteine methyltransferase
MARSTKKEELAKMTLSSPQFPADRADTDTFFAFVECSLGSTLVAQSKQGVCAILVGDDRASLVRELLGRFPKAKLTERQLDHEEILAKIVGLIEHPGISLDLPLDVRGTAFQQRVWRALQEIPPGSTATYTEIAEKIEMPKAVRAVAQACASNVLAVAIPCHRVIRRNGSQSGYRWGAERKSALLEREAHP